MADGPDHEDSGNEAARKRRDCASGVSQASEYLGCHWFVSDPYEGLLQRSMKPTLDKASSMLVSGYPYSFCSIESIKTFTSSNLEDSSQRMESWQTKNRLEGRVLKGDYGTANPTDRTATVRERGRRSEGNTFYSFMGIRVMSVIKLELTAFELLVLLLCRASRSTWAGPRVVDLYRSA